MQFACEAFVNTLVVSEKAKVLSPVAATVATVPEKLPAIVDDYIQKVRLEKSRLDQNDVSRVPRAACILEEFKKVALTTHHPYERSQKAKEWILKNKKQCNQSTWTTLTTNLPNWLGTAYANIKFQSAFNKAE